MRAGNRFAGALLLILPALGMASTAVTWDLATTESGLFNLGHQETFTGTDGAALSVEAFSLRPGESAWSDALINQSIFGLGVTSQWFDNPQIDNYLRYDVLRFALPTGVDAGTFMLTLGFSNDDYLIWGNNTGVLPDSLTTGDLNGTALAGGRLTTSPEAVAFDSETAFSYLFVGGELATYCGCGIFQADDFMVSALTVSPVPIPPAAILFGSALVGVAVLARRRRPKPEPQGTNFV